MKRPGSWYFDGYVRRERVMPNGKTKQVLEYTGEWYGLKGGKAELSRLKLQTLSLALVAFAAYLVAQFNPSAGGMVHWLAIPSLLSLVGMIYMVVGFINFLPVKEEWEIRNYYAGYRRLRWSSWVTLILYAIWAAMELCYVALNLGDFLGELVYLLLALAATAAMVLEVRLFKLHPAIVVKGPKVE